MTEHEQLSKNPLVLNAIRRQATRIASTLTTEELNKIIDAEREVQRIKYELLKAKDAADSVASRFI